MVELTKYNVLMVHTNKLRLNFRFLFYKNNLMEIKSPPEILYLRRYRTIGVCCLNTPDWYITRDITEVMFGNTRTSGGEQCVICGRMQKLLIVGVSVCAECSEEHPGEDMTILTTKNASGAPKIHVYTRGRIYIYKAHSYTAGRALYDFPRMEKYIYYYSRCKCYICGNKASVLWQRSGYGYYCEGCYDDMNDGVKLVTANYLTMRCKMRSGVWPDILQLIVDKLIS